MKQGIFIFILLIVSSTIFSQEKEIPAFPGAQGGAANITGGRGGKILYVTNLRDDGKEGSLRWAVKQKGARTILFGVAGIIELEEPLEIKHDSITIAGQSAPGDGICLKNYPVKVRANNVIVRFLRFRMGDERGVEADALTGIRNNDIMIDHCSISWATDECASFYDNENFTMQWCIISESLKNSVHRKGSHGYGAIWGGKKASYHHNLLAHHDSRNPRFCGSRYSNQPELEKVDFRNNVIYNWGSNSGYGGEGGEYNIVGNYYKPGPATKKGKASYRIFSPNSDAGANKQPKGVWGKFYLAGNHVDGNNSATIDNWLGFQPDFSPDENIPIQDIQSAEEFFFFNYTPQTAIEAYNEVLNKAGASLTRDDVDIRIIDEVKKGTYTYEGSRGSKNGLIDSQTDVSGWPVYNNHTSITDTDGDGIPDEWEIANNLNPNDPLDGNACSLNENFTNIEVYLNSLVNHLY